VRPFESRWERIFPYVLGAMFGLSVALLVISIIMFIRIGDRAAGIPTISGARISENIARERSGAIIEATRVVSPAVVSITTMRTALVRPNPFLNYHRLFQRYFSNRSIPEVYRERYSIYGSGVIVSQDGYISTNEHVVRDAEQIVATLSDGTEVDAELIGSSVVYDLALVRIDAQGLPFVPLGESAELEIGEWVIAIGSPFGYLLNDTQPTVTVGVISALNRDVKSSPESNAIFRNMIQTDAAINPGNSGGPLVASNGEVVGINTFIFSNEDGTTLGIGFAIPANIAKMVMDEFKRYGKVRGVWTGLIVAEMNPNMAATLGINTVSGLLVDRIVEGSPAADADMQVGDVIVEAHGMVIEGAREVSRAIYGLRVGDILELVVIRGGERKAISLELAEAPSRI
jgi:S1-C subfamily serine protease